MENAPTAIMWSSLRTFLRIVKCIARNPDDHVSFGHLNELQPVPLCDTVAALCRAEIMAAQSNFETASGVYIVCGRLLVVLGPGIGALAPLSPVQNRL
jgi:hypothetical protein